MSEQICLSHTRVASQKHMRTIRLQNSVLRVLTRRSEGLSYAQNAVLLRMPWPLYCNKQGGSSNSQEWWGLMYH